MKMMQTRTYVPIRNLIAISHKLSIGKTYFERKVFDIVRYLVTYVC